MPRPGAALAGLLARRLTHDLAGPLTALGTLAAMREADPLEEAALADLRDRLALFRAIFGGTGDAPVDLAETVALLSRQTPEVQHVLELAPEAPPARLRAALALALEVRGLAGTAGRISARVAADGALRVVVEPLGRAVPESLRLACEGAHASVSPEHAPAAFAAALAGPIRLVIEDSTLVLEADPG